MGAASVEGGMMPEQASADEILALGTGAPASVAIDAVFMPLRVMPTLVGNPKADVPTNTEAAPAQFTFKYMSALGLQVKKFPVCSGQQLRKYLRSVRLLGMLVGGRRSPGLINCLVANGKLVRMTYVPHKDDVVSLGLPLRHSQRRA